jgi:hypothetical protein
MIWAIAIGVSFAQEKEVEGIVFDKDTQFRLTRVNIKNLRTNVSIYNTTKGEFKLSVREGDNIVAVISGYRLDTITYTNQTALLFYLQRLAIPLQQVVVTDSVLSAKRRYEEMRRQFNSLNRLGNNKDLLAIGSGSVGFSIDALWSAFSKEGKNARRLMDVMERDYKNNFIDEKFSKTLITRVTGLKGDKLEVFIHNYRPSYYFVYGASEYDLVSYIKMAFIRFNKNPYREDLSELSPILE